MVQHNELITEIKKAFESGEIEYFHDENNKVRSRDGVITLEVYDLDIFAYGTKRSFRR
jgi:hypothetical protein